MTETFAPYGSVPQTDFASQYARLFEATECRTQRELATLLDVRQSSISDAKRRQSVPSNWLAVLFDKKQINPQWIRTGMGEKRTQATDAAVEKTSYITLIKRIPMEGCTTDELFAEIIRRATRVINVS